MRVYEATEISVDKSTWLIYGFSGVGKTALIGTFPQPICVTNFLNENGAKTIREHPGVTVVDIEASDDIEGWVNWVFKQQTERVERGLKPFATVALDSMTSCVELLTGEYVAKNGPIRIPTDLHLYDAWGTSMRTVVDRLRKLDAEIVVTTTAFDPNDTPKGKEGTRQGGPDLFRSLARRLPPKMDNTIYLEAETFEDAIDKTVRVRRRAWMVPHNGMTARVRGYIGPPYMDGATYAKIREQMKESLFG